MTASTGPARRTALIGFALAAAFAAGIGTGFVLDGGDDPALADSSPAGDAATGADRKAEVAARGSEVMPFDLDATTHRFDKDPDGGLQTVVADDPTDSVEIDEIRQHLREEADAFSQGDMSDPASIHGEDMPGLAVLEQRAATLTVIYADRTDGAEIRFSSPDPTTVDALHQWFDAQVSDHGDHAEHVS